MNTLEEFQDAVGAQEKIAPSQEALVTWQGKVVSLGADRIKFVQLFVVVATHGSA